MRTEDHNPSVETGSPCCHSYCSFAFVDFYILYDWVWRAEGGRADFHTGFRTITLVLYIESLPNLATRFPCGRGKPFLFWGH